MAEKPILFSDKMVQAILSGTKTQTRRLVKPQPTDGAVPKPKFNVGDVLWVREAWQGPLVDCDFETDGFKMQDFHKPEFCAYRASGDSNEHYNEYGDRVNQWKPSLFMPRWASRLQLEVTAIRMERLNDISEDDADAEGVLACDGMFDDADYCRIAKEIGSGIGDLKPAFVQLWQSIYGPDSWSQNPWVWVIEFKVAQVGEE